MYETYWNLTEKPFHNATNTKFFFYGETYEEAYHRLMYTIAENYGVVALTSEGGCGKSFVCKTIFKQMQEQGAKVAYIANPDYEPFEFLQQTACEYGLEFRNKSKIELIKDIKDFVNQNHDKGTKVILFIDDCHLIQSKKTLEELRLLMNWENNNAYPLTVIFSGKPEFMQMVRRLPALKDRIALQYRLQALNCQETGEYIYHRLRKAGCDKEIFSVEAIQEIHAQSGGVPRQINNICDLALLLGYGEAKTSIDVAVVQKVVDDLKN